MAFPGDTLICLKERITMKVDLFWSFLAMTATAAPELNGRAASGLLQSAQTVFLPVGPSVFAPMVGQCGRWPIVGLEIERIDYGRPAQWLK